jgi:hypothetical protein
MEATWPIDSSYPISYYCVDMRLSISPRIYNVLKNGPSGCTAIEARKTDHARKPRSTRVLRFLNRNFKIEHLMKTKQLQFPG